jgi:hypothetical protein
MKKVMFVLVALLMASPALADVQITCEADGDGNNVISFDASTEPNLVRAFALDITVDDGNITKVECLDPNYYVYPGSIEISGGDVDSWGSCLCTAVPANSVTIEMASLYQKGVEPAPGKSGDLVRVSYDAGATMVITLNDLRGGVVMENPYEQPTVDIGDCACVVPACWSYLTQCHGDSDNTGDVKGSDFLALKDSWYKVYGEHAEYDPCADFDRNGEVKGSDFLTLKNNWYQTVTPNCPTGDLNNIYGCD